MCRIWIDLVIRPLNFISYHLKTLLMVKIQRLINANPDEFIVVVTIVHQGKYYGAHVIIPFEKQNMTHVSELTSGLAGAAGRKIKELLFGPK